jgi:hypothetical protein
MAVFRLCPRCETSTAADVVLCDVCGGPLIGAARVLAAPDAEPPRVRVTDHRIVPSVRPRTDVPPPVERRTSDTVPTWPIEPPPVRWHLLRALRAVEHTLRRLLRG